jgi:hypothetical protein
MTSCNCGYNQKVKSRDVRNTFYWEAIKIVDPVDFVATAFQGMMKKEKNENPISTSTF